MNAFMTSSNEYFLNLIPSTLNVSHTFLKLRNDYLESRKAYHFTPSPGPSPITNSLTHPLLCMGDDISIRTPQIYTPDQNHFHQSSKYVSSSPLTGSINGDGNIAALKKFLDYSTQEAFVAQNRD